VAGALLTLTDVSLRRESEAAVRRSESRLRVISA
jgi:hypothetical protein